MPDPETELQKATDEERYLHNELTILQSRSQELDAQINATEKSQQTSTSKKHPTTTAATTTVDSTEVENILSDQALLTSFLSAIVAVLAPIIMFAYFWKQKWEEECKKLKDKKEQEILLFSDR